MFSVLRSDCLDHKVQSVSDILTVILLRKSRK